MMNPMEEKQSAQYAATCNQAQGGMLGNPMAMMDEPAQETLRGRVVNDLRRARREALKRERLEELSYLLDKNPEVARILELIEATR